MKKKIVAFALLLTLVITNMSCIWANEDYKYQLSYIQNEQNQILDFITLEDAVAEIQQLNNASGLKLKVTDASEVIVLSKIIQELTLDLPEKVSLQISDCSKIILENKIDADLTINQSTLVTSNEDDKINIVKGSKNFHLDTGSGDDFVNYLNDGIIDDNIDVLNDAYFNNVETIKLNNVSQINSDAVFSNDENNLYITTSKACYLLEQKAYSFNGNSSKTLVWKSNISGYGQELTFNLNNDNSKFELNQINPQMTVKKAILVLKDSSDSLKVAKNELYFNNVLLKLADISNVEISARTISIANVEVADDEGYLKLIDKINGLMFKVNFDRDRQMQINGNIVKVAIDSVINNLDKIKIAGNNLHLHVINTTVALDVDYFGSPGLFCYQESNGINQNRNYVIDGRIVNLLNCDNISIITDKTKDYHLRVDISKGIIDIDGNNLIIKDNEGQIIETVILNDDFNLVINGNDLDSNWILTVNTLLNGKIKIIGNGGNDVLDIKKLQADKIKLEFDVEEINANFDQDTSLTAQELIINGTAKKFNANFARFEISGAFKVIMDHHLSLDNLAGYGLGIDLSSQLKLTNGMIKANDIDIALNNKIEIVDQEVKSMINVNIVNAVELFMDNMKLIATIGAVKLKSDSEVIIDLKTGNGSSNLSVITLVLNSQAINQLNDCEIDSALDVVISADNIFTGKLISDGEYQATGSSEASSGAYVVISAINLKASSEIGANIRSKGNVAITSNVTNHADFSTKVKIGDGNIDFEGLKNSLNDILDFVDDKISNSKILDLVRNTLIDILSIISSIDSSSSDLNMQLLGQLVGSGVINYMNIINQANLTGNLKIVGNIQILANRDDIITIVADGSAIKETGYFQKTPGAGVALTLNIILVDQKASLNSVKTLADTLTISSLANSKYDINVKGGYVKEGFGSGGAINGNFITIDNQAIICKDSNLVLEQDVVVKAKEDTAITIISDANGDGGSFGSAIGLLVYLDNVKSIIENNITFNKVSNLNIEAVSNAMIKNDIMAGGNGGTSKAPAFGVNVLVSRVEVLLDSGDVINAKDINIYGEAVKTLTSNLTSNLLAGTPGLGSSVGINIISGKVDAKLLRSVNIDNLNISTKYNTRSDLVVIASPDGEINQEDDLSIKDFAPSKIYDNVRKSISNSIDNITTSIKDFNLLDNLFKVEYDTTEGEVAKASTVVGNVVIGEANAIIGENVKVNAKGNVDVLAKAAVNLYCLAYSNVEGQDGKSGGAAAVAGIIVKYANNALVNGDIVAANLTVKSVTDEVEKIIDLDSSKIATNDTNTYILSTVSGTGGANSSKSGSVVVAYISQNYQAKVTGNVDLSGAFEVISSVHEKILTSALASPDVEFGVKIGWKAKSKGTGIGVSVNFVDTQVKAIVGDENKKVTIKADRIKVLADYATDTTVVVEIGETNSMASNKSTMDGAVAVNLIEPVINAKINNVNLDITNDLDVNANYTGSTNTKIAAQASAGSKSNGGTVSYLLIRSDLEASVNADGKVGKTASILSNADIFNDLYAEATAEGALIGKYTQVLNIDFKAELKAQFKGKTTPLSSLASKIAGKFGGTGGTSLSTGLLASKDVTTPDTKDQSGGEKQKGNQVSISAALSMMMLENTVKAFATGGLTVGKLNVTALNNSNYHIVSVGNAKANKTAVSLGVAVVFSENNTTAYIGDVTSNGTIDVNATNRVNYDDKYLNDLTISVYNKAKAKSDIGGEDSGSLTLAGAGVYLEVNDRTAAYISNGAKVIAQDKISLNAQEFSKYAIRALAYSTSNETKGNGIGLGFAMLNINSALESYIDQNAYVKASDLDILSNKYDVDSNKFKFEIEFPDLDLGNLTDLDSEIIDKLKEQLLQATAFLSMHNYYVDVLGGSTDSKGSFNASGAAGVILFKDKLRSYISDNAIIELIGKLNINANCDTSLMMITGALATTETTAVGLNCIMVENENIVEAFIGKNCNINARSLNISAKDDKEALMVGVAAGKSEKATIGGAVNVILSNNQVNAYVDEHSKLFIVEDLTILAENLFESDNIMLNGFIGGKFGMAASVSFIDFTGNTYAGIKDGVVVAGFNKLDSFAGSLSVKAVAKEDIMTVIFGGGYSSSAAVEGTVAYKNINSTIKAIIGDNCDIKVKQLNLDADSNTRMLGILGGITVSKGGAVGGASDSNNYKKHIYSKIGASRINTKYNLSVSSNSTDYVLSIVIGVGGSKTVALNGSIPVTIIENEIEASLDGDDEEITVGEDLLINTLHNLTLVEYAGSLNASKVAVGAAVTTITVTGSLKAYLNGRNINAKSVSVKAIKEDDYNVGSISGGAASSVAAEGAVLTLLVNSEVLAIIGKDSQLNLAGDLSVLASNKITNISCTGALSAAGSVGVGASVVTLTLSSQASCIIDENVIVKGSENVVIVSDVDYQFDIYVVGFAASGSVAVGANVITIVFDSVVNAKINKNSNISGDGSLLIMARENQHLDAKLGGIAGAGAVGINASAITMVVSSNDNIEIGDNTIINLSGNKNASYDGIIATGIKISAFANQEYYTYLAVASGSGTVAVNANAVVLILKNKVGINSGAMSSLTTSKDVNINVENNTDLKAYIGALAISGTVAVVPGVLYVNSTKSGKINLLSDINGADVNINSFDSSNFEGILVGAGGSIVAVNGIALVLMIDDTVASNVNGGTINAVNVDVQAANKVKNRILTGTFNAGGVAVGLQTIVIMMNSSIDAAVNHVNANSLVVKAAGIEDFDNIAAIGGSAGGVAVAGSALVIILNNIVSAKINAQANVKANTIIVEADDDIIIGANAGSAGVGAIGAGAAVNVLLIKNTINAQVGHDALLTGINGNYATSIKVLTKVTRDIKAITASAAVGGVGISGNVLVLSIGSVVDSQMNEALKINNQNQIVEIQNAINKIDLSNAQNVAGGDLEVDLGQAVNAAKVSDSNSAIVEQGAYLKANDVEIIADDKTTLTVLTGAATAGLVASVGAAVSVITIGNKVNAIVNGNIDATNTIKIHALADEHSYDITSVAGSGSIFVSLGANVGIVNISTIINAAAGNMASFKNFEMLDIKANYQSKNSELIKLNVGSIRAGGLMAAGTTVVTLNFTAALKAMIGDGKTNTVLIDAVNGTINASSKLINSAVINGIASNGGIISGDAIVLLVNAKGSSTVYVGGNSCQIKTINAINNVQQPVTISLRTDNYGAYQGGMMVVNVTSQSNINNFVYGNIKASQDINLKTYYNTDDNNNQSAKMTISTKTGSGSLVGVAGAIPTIKESSNINNTIIGNIEANNVSSIIRARLDIYLTMSGASAGLVSGAVKTITVTTDANISNNIGDKSLLKVTNLTLNNIIRTYQDIEITGVSITGIGVNTTIVDAKITPTISINVGNGASIFAKDKIELYNWYNVQPLFISDNLSSLTNTGIKVITSSNGGSLIGGDGTKTYLNHNSKIYTHINANGVVYAGNAVKIASYGAFDANCEYNSATLSLISIGANLVTVDVSGIILNEVHENAQIISHAIVIFAINCGDIKVTTIQSSAGIAGGNGNEIDVTGTFNIKNQFDSSGKLMTLDKESLQSWLTNNNISNFIINQNFTDATVDAGAIAIYALGYLKIQGTVEGKSLSGVNVGVSNIDYSTTINVSNIFKDKSEINSYRSLSIQAFYSGDITLTAKTSSGNLIGIDSTKTKFRETTNILNQFENNVVIKGQTVAIQAVRALNSANITNDCNQAGIIGSGKSELDITFAGDAKNNFGTNVTIQTTGDLAIEATINIEGIKVLNYGGCPISLISGDTTKSTLTINSGAYVTFGNNLVINSDGDVAIIANIGNVTAHVETVIPDKYSAVTANYATTTINVYTNGKIDLANQANIQASGDLTLRVIITKLDLYAKAYSKVYAAGSYSHAKSYINLKNILLAINGSNATLKAGKTLEIQVLTSDDLSCHTYAFAEIGGGVTGKVYATSNVNIRIDSNITLTGNGDYTGKDVSIYAQTPTQDDKIQNQEAHCEAKTVVNYVHQTIKKVLRVVETVTEKICGWLPWPLNKLVKWIVKTVVKFIEVVVDVVVEVILGSDVKKDTDGYFDDYNSSKIIIDGTINYGMSAGLTIVVDANGNVQAPTGTKWHREGNKIIIDSFGSLGIGSCKIVSATGTLHGAMTIVRNSLLSDIKITNNSSYDLYIGTLDLSNNSAEDADYIIQCMDNLYDSNGNIIRSSNYKITETYKNSQNIDELKATITSTDSKANVYLTGDLYLPGFMLVMDIAGSCYTTGKSELFIGNLKINKLINLGTKDNYFLVYFGGGDFNSTFEMSVVEAYLRIVLEEVVDGNLADYQNKQLVLEINKLVAAGNLSLSLADGIITTNKATINTNVTLEPIYEKQIKAKYTVDEEGNILYEYVLDANGNKIIAKDEEGNELYVVDEDGNIYYQYEIVTEEVEVIIDYREVISSSTSDITTMSVVSNLNIKGNIVVNSFDLKAGNTNLIFMEGSLNSNDGVNIIIGGVINTTKTSGVDITTDKLTIINTGNNVINKLFMSVDEIEIRGFDSIDIINNKDLSGLVNGVTAKITAKAVNLQNSSIDYLIVNATDKVSVNGTIKNVSIDTLKDIILVTDVDLVVNHIYTAGNLDLEVNGKLTAKSDVTNVKAINITIQANMIGNTDNFLVIDIDGTADLISGKDVYLEILSDLIIKKITAKDTVFLKGTGNISQIDNGKIIGKNLVIDITGDLGTALQVISLDIETIDLTSSNAYFSNALENDLQVIKMNVNDVICLMAGNLTGINEISGNYLIAKISGNFGKIEKVIKTNVDKIKLNVSGSIYLNNNLTKDLIIESIIARNEIIMASGNIQVSDDRQNNIEAKRLEMNVAGSIASSLAPIKMLVEKIKITVQDDIYLVNDLTKDLTIESIIAGNDVVMTIGNAAIGSLAANGNVDLNVSGNIIASSDEVNIVANRLQIIISGDVAEFDEVLKTSVNTLLIIAGDSIYITNDSEKDLLIENMTSNQEIRLITGNLTVMNLVTDDLEIRAKAIAVAYLEAAAVAKLTAAGDITGLNDQTNIKTAKLVADVEGDFGKQDRFINTDIDTLVIEADKNIYLNQNIKRDLLIEKAKALNGWIVINSGEIKILDLYSRNLGITSNESLVLGSLTIFDQVILEITGDVSALDNEDYSLAANRVDARVGGDFGTGEMPVRFQINELSIIAGDNIYITNDLEKDLLIENMTSNQIIDLIIGKATINYLATNNLNLISNDLIIKEMQINELAKLDVDGDIGVITGNDHNFSAKRLELTLSGNLGSEDVPVLASISEMNVIAGDNIYLSNDDGLDLLVEKMSSNQLIVLITGNVEIVNLETTDLILSANNLILDQIIVKETVRMQLSGNLTVRQELDSKNILGDKFNIIANRLEISSSGNIAEIDLPLYGAVKIMNITAGDNVYLTNDVTLDLLIENLASNEIMAVVMGNVEITSLTTKQLDLVSKEMLLTKIIAELAKMEINGNLIVNTVDDANLTADILDLTVSENIGEQDNVVNSAVKVMQVIANKEICLSNDKNLDLLIKEIISNELIQLVVGNVEIYNLQTANLLLDGNDLILTKMVGNKQIVLNLSGNLEVNNSNTNNLSTKSLKADIAGNIASDKTPLKMDVEELTLAAANAYINNDQATDITINKWLVGQDSKFNFKNATINYLKTGNSLKLTGDKLKARDIIAGNEAKIGGNILNIANIKAGSVDIQGADSKIDTIVAAMNIKINSPVLELNKVSGNDLFVYTGSNLIIESSLTSETITAQSLKQTNIGNLLINIINTNGIIELNNHGDVSGQNGVTNINGPVLIIKANNVLNLVTNIDALKIDASVVKLNNLKGLTVSGNTSNSTFVVNGKVNANNFIANSLLDLKSGSLSGNLVANTLKLVCGSVDLKAKIHKLDAIISGKFKIVNQGSLQIDRMQASNIDLTNFGDVNSAKQAIAGDGMVFDIQGQAVLNTSVNRIAGQASTGIEINNSKNLKIDTIESKDGVTSGGDLKLVINGDLDVNRKLQGNNLLDVTANSLNIPAALLANTIILTGKEKAIINGEIISNDFTLNGANENDLIISDTMGNVTVKMPDNNSNTNIIINSLSKLFSYQGGLGNDIVKVLVNQITGKMSFASQGGKDSVAIDLANAKGKAAIDINSFHDVMMMLGSKNDNYRFDRKMMSVSNEQFEGKVQANKISNYKVIDQGGKNEFIFVDTFAKTTINSGNGNDTFKIGVIVKNSDNATDTTEGYLSYGNSHKLVIDAGNGNNSFRIYSSKKGLEIISGNGNDTYELKTFIKEDGYKTYQNGKIKITDRGGKNVISIIKASMFNKYDIDDSSVLGDGFDLEFTGIDKVNVKSFKPADGATKASSLAVDMQYSIIMLVQNYSLYLIVFGLMVLALAIFIIKKRSIVIKKDKIRC